MYSSPVRHCTSGLLRLLVRLACVKRAASVRSEPGSNSHELGVLRICLPGPPLQYTFPLLAVCSLSLYSVVKEQITTGAVHSKTKKRNLSRGVPVSARIKTRIVARGELILSCVGPCQAKTQSRRKFFLRLRILLSLHAFRQRNQIWILKQWWCYRAANPRAVYMCFLRSHFSDPLACCGRAGI